MLPTYGNISTQTIDDNLVQKKNLQLKVLRLDKVHPVISGNKIFKLNYFFDGIKEKNVQTIITFGGAYSNHLVAAAYACKLNNINCIGIVRGEKPAQLSHTLQHCLEYGMQLQFISREEYRKKNTAVFIQHLKEQYGNSVIIPEGGYDPLGAKGAGTIMNWIAHDITHICCAAGTATTVAGLLYNAKPTQQIIAFPVLKGLNDTWHRISFLTGGTFNKEQLHIENNYHFGGYAKKTTTLIEFMNALYLQHQLPTDFVYTGKMMYGTMDLIKKDYFPAGSKILCIHTGGLQGNLSLAMNTLTF